jgi:hypothetical protein
LTPPVRRANGAALALASLATIVLACHAPGPTPRAEAPYEFHLSRRVPSADREAGEVDPRTRERDQAKRFPGVEAIDLVKVVIAPLERSGPCWTAVSSSDETTIEAHYVLAEDDEDRSASSFADLDRQGWQGVYRSPSGIGFERRASFRSVDLAATTALTCSCATRDGTRRGDRRAVTLRVRWSEGEMPAVSTTSRDGGAGESLRPTLTSGSLFGWEFTDERKFPDGYQGRCGVRVDLYVLATPPVL